MKKTRDELKDLRRFGIALAAILIVLDEDACVGARVGNSLQEAVSIVAELPCSIFGRMFRRQIKA